MTPTTKKRLGIYLRSAIEKLNYSPHNDVYKVAFEWCERYGLNDPERCREKSRFLDGIRLGSYLEHQKKNSTAKN